MIDKKIKTKKSALKSYFLMLNLIVATIAFSYLIGSVNAQTCIVDPVTGKTSCSGEVPEITPQSSEVPPSNAQIPNTGSAGSDQSYIQKSGIWQDDSWDNWPQPAQSSAGTQSGRIAQGSCSPPGCVVGADGATAPSYPAKGSEVSTGVAVSTAPGIGGAIEGYFNEKVFLGNIVAIGGAALIGAGIGSLVGGKNSALWGAVSGAAGVFSYQMAKIMLGTIPRAGLYAGLIGIGVAAAIFLLTYKKESKEIAEFNCLPWQAPIGGADCEKCNDYAECSEYTCKSLGQACDLVNKGTQNQKCIWKNPYDTNSPIIEMKSVSAGNKFIPDKAIRPPATGVAISQDNEACIKAFTPLEFTFITNEPSQCKIDYNLTSDSKLAYEQMGFYVGGSSVFEYNHTEILSLPGPDAINKVAPELKNDGTYTLYIRCQDANGNFNVNPFSVRFCVEKGPDTTPPLIVNVSIPSGNPIQFNRSSLYLEVYVNEPSDCKWSHEDRDYNNMEYSMSCSNQIWQMNNQETYTCRTNLTGIKSREDNVFYFRCKDKPYFDESERNVNKQSYRYSVIGTQPLNILKIEPNETISGATDVINITLYVKTDNGYKNGEAICYYSTTGNEKDYVQFLETGGNEHKQRQDLVTGSYTYYIKCVDLGGNAVYNSTGFSIEIDRIDPFITRAYKESGGLKIITDENAECAYSNVNCNFEIDSGIKMTSLDYRNHNTEWKLSRVYYIRCKDKYNNQPNPNTCSIILRPSDFEKKGNTLEIGSS